MFPQVPGRSPRVVVVGAGLAGLSAALHLRGRGADVTLIERQPSPGGVAGQFEESGYRFDTGPTVLTMPELLDNTLSAVGEAAADWLTLDRIDPAYRGFFPDGSHFDVIADPDAMSENIRQVLGEAEAAGFRQYSDYVRDLYHWQIDDFIDRNFDGPTDLLTPNLFRLLKSGAFRSLAAKANQYLQDPRTRQLLTFQALYAGVSPRHARAIYGVISYMDAIAGVFAPKGGMFSVSQAFADAASKHGVTISYNTTATGVELRGPRAQAVITDGGRIPADAVVLAGDYAASQALLSGRSSRRSLKYSPSAYVLQIGSTQGYRNLAHHNIHFGAKWDRTFREIISTGHHMSDPSILVSHLNHTDPSMAPSGGHSYYVLFPAPNLRVGHAAIPDQEYEDHMWDVLAARGYTGLAEHTQVKRLTSPMDWARLGLTAGTPFAAAHTMWQSGPFRPSNTWGENVVFAGAGTTPGVGVPMVLISGKLAAERIMPSSGMFTM